MPKCRKSVYCKLCAATILRCVQAVRKLVGPVRKARRVEAVHDMRVALRRMRAAMGLFEPCLPAPARRWRRKIRKVTRALGTARDLDVQMATVESFMRRKGHASWGPGLECLLENLRNRRRSVQGEVAKVLAHMGKSGVLDDMERKFSEFAEAPPDDRAEYAKTYKLAGKTILDLLENLKSYQRDLARPKAISSHHAMRIAAKHLRYSLEVFEPLYGRSTKRALWWARKMQTLLGELHDCDMWVESLPGFLAGGVIPAAEDAGTIELLSGGIEAFRRNRLRHRQAIYRKCLRNWQLCMKEKTWPRLCETIKMSAGRRGDRRTACCGASGKSSASMARMCGTRGT